MRGEGDPRGRSEPSGEFRTRDGRGPRLASAAAWDQRAGLQVLHHLRHLLREPSAHGLDGIDAGALVVRGGYAGVNVGARDLEVRSEQPQVLERPREAVYEEHHVVAAWKVRSEGVCHSDREARRVGGDGFDRFDRRAGFDLTFEI